MNTQVKVEKSNFNSKEVKSIETLFGKNALAAIEKLSVKGGARFASYPVN